MKSPSNKWALKRLGIIPVFFLSMFSGCYAQLYNTDAQSLGLAGCYASSPEGSTGLSNEAALGIAKPLSWKLSHVRPFVIKELGISSISSRFPLFPGNMQCGLQHYGIPGYQQVNSSLGYGMKLAEKIYAGIGFRYYNTITQGEWSYLRTLGISGGVLVRTGESTWIGVHIVNPVTINNYTAYGSLFPSLLSLGLQSTVYSSTNIFGDISYHSYRGIIYHFAAEYKYSGRVTLRAGYHSNPTSFSLGAGLLVFPLKFDIAFVYSLRHGITPALTLTYLTK